MLAPRILHLVMLSQSLLSSAARRELAGCSCGAPLPTGQQRRRVLPGVRHRTVHPALLHRRWVLLGSIPRRANGMPCSRPRPVLIIFGGPCNSPLPCSHSYPLPSTLCPCPSCPGLYYYKTPVDNQWSAIDLAQLAQRAQQDGGGAPKASGCSVRAWVVSEQREECAGMHGWQRACSTQPWQPCCPVAGGTGQHCLACMLSPPL